MDVIPHDRDSGPLKDEEKQRLLNALNDLGEPADDSAGTDHAADKVLTADEASLQQCPASRPFCRLPSWCQIQVKQSEYFRLMTPVAAYSGLILCQQDHLESWS